jgi:hypothetical protein
VFAALHCFLRLFARQKGVPDAAAAAVFEQMQREVREELGERMIQLCQLISKIVGPYSCVFDIWLQQGMRSPS